MFLLRPPSDARITNVLHSQRDSGYSYSHPLTGYIEDHNQIRLGAGADAFRRARAAIEDWRMFPRDWIRIHPERPPVQEGVTVAIVVSHYGFRSLNVCRIRSVIDELRQFGFVYGTLPEHAERGEERFQIEWRDDDSVWYVVLAQSLPGHALARIAKPLARRLQRRFARDSMQAMARSVS